MARTEPSRKEAAANITDATALTSVFNVIANIAAHGEPDSALFGESQRARVCGALLSTCRGSLRCGALAIQKIWIRNRCAWSYTRIRTATAICRPADDAPCSVRRYRHGSVRRQRHRGPIGERLHHAHCALLRRNPCAVGVA